MIVGRRDVVTARQTFTEPPIDRNADRSCVAVPYIQSSVPCANGRKLPCASFRVFGPENATRAAAACQTFTEPQIDRNADRSCVAVPYIQSSVPCANGRKLPCASFRVFGPENATRAAARHPTEEAVPSGPRRARRERGGRAAAGQRGPVELL